MLVVCSALCTPDLFISLHNLISTYPCPPSLQASLLDHLHAILRLTLPNDPQAIKLTATRFLNRSSEPQGPEFVDRLKDANDVLLQSIKGFEGRNQEREGLGKVYAEFVDEWCRKNIDVNLVRLIFPYQ